MSNFPPTLLSTCASMSDRGCHVVPELKLIAKHVRPAAKVKQGMTVSGHCELSALQVAGEIEKQIRVGAPHCGSSNCRQKLCEHSSRSCRMRATPARASQLPSWVGRKSDIEHFQTAAGLQVKDPTLVLVPGSGTSSHSSGDEA